MYLFGQPERALLVFHDASAATRLHVERSRTGPAANGIYLLNPTPAGCPVSPWRSGVSGGGGRIAWTHQCPTRNVAGRTTGLERAARRPRRVGLLGGAIANGGGIASVSNSLDGARIVFIADKANVEQGRALERPVFRPRRVARPARARATPPRPT